MNTHRHCLCHLIQSFNIPVYGANTVPLIIGTQIGDHSLTLRLPVFVRLLRRSATTHSHRDYPCLYVSWALVLLPPIYAQGFALGVCVHFIGSSGLSKLWIGGAMSWSSPSTMRKVLTHYSKLGYGWGPAMLVLNALFCKHNILLTAVSVGTLIFECIMTPMSLFIAPQHRIWMTATSVGLHIGTIILLGTKLNQ